jgi:hypothetical protein
LYESYRKGGLVLSRYWGPVDPEFAEFVRSLDGDDGEVAGLDRPESLARREAVERIVKAFGRAVEVATAETMAAAGYHRPKRGVWRKRRG